MCLSAARASDALRPFSSFGLYGASGHYVVSVAEFLMLIGRLAPIPDSLRFGQSNGAKRLDALRAHAVYLDSFRLSRNADKAVCKYFGDWVRYSRSCFDTAARLREQGNYLIQVGVR